MTSKELDTLARSISAIMSASIDIKNLSKTMYDNAIKQHPINEPEKDKAIQLIGVNHIIVQANELLANLAGAEN